MCSSVKRHARTQQARLSLPHPHNLALNKDTSEDELIYLQRQAALKKRRETRAKN